MHDSAALINVLSAQIADARVVATIASVPREQFVPEALQAHAYENTALEIECGQTVSQPTVVARMCELLTLSPGDRVLDVGTGSGYHAAVLARLAARVDSIERHASLSGRARENLAAAGIENVHLHVGDGKLGLPERAPFDAINVAAATGRIPPALEEQLAPGGRLVLPLRSVFGQRLVLVRRTAAGLVRSEHEQVRFVALRSGVPSD